MNMCIRYLPVLYLCIVSALAAVTLDKELQGVIVSGQGSELETFKYTIDSPKSITLRGSYSLKIRFDISGVSTPLDQASVIVSRQGDARNIVGFASKNTDGSFEGTFSWDDWENQFGPIVQGEWDVSIAIGHSSPKTALLKKVATLTYAPGPASPALPGTVPVKARIADVTASLSQKPEIIHQFRPEETMVAAPVSFFFTAVIMLPTGAALGLMMHLGANVKGYYMQERANVANLFHAGVIAIIAIHLAFWIKFNLIQILPVLIPVEVATVLLGIKLSSSFTRTEARAKDKTA